MSDSDLIASPQQNRHNFRDAMAVFDFITQLQVLVKRLAVAEKNRHNL
jgi:hypothetical protein